MKSDDTLVRLSKNPYYKLTSDEAQRVQNIVSAPAETPTIDLTKKKVTGTLGNAAVKETGQLNKHQTDPVNGGSWTTL